MYRTDRSEADRQRRFYDIPASAFAHPSPKGEGPSLLLHQAACYWTAGGRARIVAAMRSGFLVGGIFGLVSLACSCANAADPRDGDLRTLNGYFPFQAVPSAAAWHDRAAEVSLRVKVAAGLWPEPTKTPLNAVVHGLMDMGDYTIEKVFFESMPGHYVTGNLYRPKKSGDGVRHPALLMPHGHWTNGRFMDAAGEKSGPRQIRESLASGAERFESAARSPFQARCV